MKSVREADLKDKKVLLRADFDIPVHEGQIAEKFRIEKQKETLDYLIENGAKVVIAAHISALDSFASLLPQLHLILGREINFLKDVDGIGDYLDNYSGPALLDNIRRFPGEKENDDKFALRLADGFDLYVNNAFAVCHRNHASVSAITGHLPAYAGLLLEEEIRELDKAIKTPSQGKIIIMGGAKASTKIPAIKNFLDKADKILIGGVIANDILKERGADVGESVVDDDPGEILKGLDLDSPKLIMPNDFNVFENKILDIGDRAIEDYKLIIGGAGMIIWNGPMGMFEKPSFEKGTFEIAKAIAASAGYKIIGGGDTIAAIEKSGLSGKFDFISTGGGAMLAFLAGDILPGLKVLGFYD